MSVTDRTKAVLGARPTTPARCRTSVRGSQNVDRALLWLAVGLATLVVGALVIGRVLNDALTRRAPTLADPTWDALTATAFGLLLLGLALVVVICARRNPIGWLMLGLILLGAVEDMAQKIGLIGLRVSGEHEAGAATWAVLSESLARPEFGFVLVVLLLFPTGRLPTRRWRPLLLALAVVFPLWFVAHLLRPGNPQEPPFVGVSNPLAVSWFANPVLHYGFLPVAGLLACAVMASLVVRYRASAGDERQQLRWLVLLAARLPIGLVGLGIASLIGDEAMKVVGDVIWIFPDIGLPLAIAIAVTRYRLYDLDLVLNRTVVYASLCVILAATYGAVVLLATRVVVTAGWTSPGVVATATLAAAAVAAPARRMIQASVDRLFGRRAWDAERVLAAFTAQWRDTPQPPTALRDVLAAALRDPEADLGFWLRSKGVFADAHGRRLPVPDPGSGRSTTLISAGGEPVALLIHDSTLDRDGRLLAAVTRSAALAVENARLQVEVLGQLAEVESSRARIIDAADAERKRVERDLHDGAQQRLVGLAMHIKLMARTSSEPVVLEGIVHELQVATRELRELARGIHPAALQEGLLAALESLAYRSPVPVHLDVPGTRLPDPIELAAYYVVAECVTNTVRHACARGIQVHGEITGSTLQLTVRDDGCGGADAGRGTGLTGLADRINVVSGRLEIDSPPGGGTTVRVSLPCAC